jgi:hypothetical protein
MGANKEQLHRELILRVSPLLSQWLCRLSQVAKPLCGTGSGYSKKSFVPEAGIVATGKKDEQ